MGTTVRSENINVVPSSAIALCKHYMVEYNGEALWQWRNIEYHPVNYINALNETLKSIGYAICPTAHRIGEQLRTSTYRLHNRVKKMNTKKRKDTISGSWFYFSVTEEEMVGVPEDVIRKREWELAKLEKECAEKNEKFVHLKENRLTACKLEYIC